MTNLTADINLDRENAHPENLLAMKVLWEIGENKGKSIAEIPFILYLLIYHLHS